MTQPEKKEVSYLPLPTSAKFGKQAAIMYLLIHDFYIMNIRKEVFQMKANFIYLISDNFSWLTAIAPKVGVFFPVFHPNLVLMVAQ